MFAMKCNIDARGKAVRLVGGLIVTIAGVAVLVATALGATGGSWVWIAGTALLAVGGFQIFEGCAGWCALRAMGIRTRL